VSVPDLDVALVDEGPWPAVRAQLVGAANRVAVAPPTADAVPALDELRVSRRSVLGAVALHTGGLGVDHGWLRIHGADLLLRNRLGPGSGLLVGHDVLGGRFAVDHGRLLGVAGEVVYAPPGSADGWQSMDRTYDEWLSWALTADLEPFYGELRWPGWELDALMLPSAYGLRVEPAPFSVPGWSPLDATRTPVPVDRLLGLR
jgi:hypothetical protein